MNKTIDTKNIYGQLVTVFEGDYVGRRIIEKGIYEGPILEYLHKLFSNLGDPVVFDVGANIGNHTLSFSLDAYHVYAFEPVPQIFSLLSKNIKQNKIDNVSLFNVALSDQNGQEEIYIFPENLGATSFDQHREDLESVLVAKRIGDELLDEQRVAGCDFIKVDVEGHEAYVLKGLDIILKKHRPFVMVEWHDQQTISRFQEEMIFEKYFVDYEIYVLGTNYDELYWANKSLGNIRRRLTKLLIPKKICLYSFDYSRPYKNILLVPKEKKSVLPD